MQVGLIFIYELLFLYMVIADGLVAVEENIVGIFCADKNWRPEPIGRYWALRDVDVKVLLAVI